MRDKGYYWIKIKRYEDDPAKWIVAYWNGRNFYHYTGSENEESFHERYDCLEIDETRLVRPDIKRPVVVIPDPSPNTEVRTGKGVWKRILVRLI
jgi:hypothetical protein